MGARRVLALPNTEETLSMRSTAVPKCVRPWACKVIACRPHFLKGVWALPGPRHINTPCAQTAHFILLFKGQFASPRLANRAPVSFHRLAAYK